MSAHLRRRAGKRTSDTRACLRGCGGTAPFRGMPRPGLPPAAAARLVRGVRLAERLREGTAAPRDRFFGGGRMPLHPRGVPVLAEERRKGSIPDLLPAGAAGFFQTGRTGAAPACSASCRAAGAACAGILSGTAFLRGSCAPGSRAWQEIARPGRDSFFTPRRTPPPIGAAGKPIHLAPAGSDPELVRGLRILADTASHIYPCCTSVCICLTSRTGREAPASGAPL